jgi:hypothetical protein
MEESFKNKLKSALAAHWKLVIENEDDSNYHAGLSETIHTLIHSATKTYRYPVITQLLAKLVNPQLDCRCIQATREHGVNDSFDARSVCHEVVVPWEFANNSPLGGSREPYINNPLRVQEFSEQYRSGQKNKAHWDLLVSLFSYLESNPDALELAFRQALLEVKRLQKDLVIQYPIPLRLSLFGTLRYVNAFLAKKSGGERLQLICYALMNGLAAHWGIWTEVRTSKINASDTSEKKAGDVVCYKDGEIVLAIEVKDQDLTLELLESFIRNARIDNVSELLAFVNWKNLGAKQALQTKIDSEFANGMNIYAVDAMEFLSLALVLMGEDGRKSFIECVCSGLDTMNCSFATKKEWARILGDN